LGSRRFGERRWPGVKRPDPEFFGSGSPSFFKKSDDQTYALCAVASCFVFNQVAYCKCDVKFGDSISLPLEFDDGQDVCTVNAEGAANGYMVSTFSVPDSVLKPNGDQAIYTCPRTSDGAYAQCDGGICFTSSEGQSFPGFDDPLAKDQIICSCPITVQNPETARVGYQITGPYPCQKSFFENCNSTTANNKTGSTIYVGAPTGTPRLLAFLLTGTNPPVNECRLPRDWDGHWPYGGGSFDMMMVPLAANMPPTPWQTEILASGICAGPGRCRASGARSPARRTCRTCRMQVWEPAAIGVDRQLVAGCGVSLGDQTAGLAARYKTQICQVIGRRMR
jgi:hypothetical protein